ncbi:MAG: hypothetical protein IKL65_00505 [Bacilli bacterium]|nr:hypothetical protein [Bacilli bacterium]MBR6689797.1 hypothetical protein [Bacilli bacterium]
MKGLVIATLIDLKCRVHNIISDETIEYIKRKFEENDQLVEENKELQERLKRIERYVVNNSNLDKGYILRTLQGRDKE